MFRRRAVFPARLGEGRHNSVAYGGVGGSLDLFCMGALSSCLDLCVLPHVGYYN